MDSAPPIAPAAPKFIQSTLVHLTEDGLENAALKIASTDTVLGRNSGGLFTSDAYLEPEHAVLRSEEEGIVLVEDRSTNGVFVRLFGSRELYHGDRFRVGQELMMYEDIPEPTAQADGSELMGSPNPGFWGRLSLMVEDDLAIRAWPIRDSGISMGRERGEILFPSDGYVSGSHCRVLGDDSGVYLEDLDSSNGTYFRARPGEVIPYGSLMLIGHHLFRIDPE